MNLAFFASRSVSARNNARFFSASVFSRKAGASSAAASHTPLHAKPVPVGQRPVAVWSVDPETGRIACRWTTDRDEIAGWLSRPWIDRLGLIFAAAQQTRGPAGSLR